MHTEEHCMCTKRSNLYTQATKQKRLSMDIYDRMQQQMPLARTEYIHIPTLTHRTLRLLHDINQKCFTLYAHYVYIVLAYYNASVCTLPKHQAATHTEEYKNTIPLRRI